MISAVSCILCVEVQLRKPSLNPSCFFCARGKSSLLQGAFVLNHKRRLSVRVSTCKQTLHNTAQEQETRLTAPWFIKTPWHRKEDGGAVHFNLFFLNTKCACQEVSWTVDFNYAIFLGSECGRGVGIKNRLHRQDSEKVKKQTMPVSVSFSLVPGNKTPQLIILVHMTFLVI